MAFLNKVFPSKNERHLKDFSKTVAQINSLEPQMQSLQDKDFALRSTQLRGRIEKGESLDTLLPEAFAAVREVSFRVNAERHFDVQLLGGIAMHKGMIAEMKTGEGKTLASTAPAYLNALMGRGVHIVTPNDYLAQRDSQWMANIYGMLGLRVGLIQHGMDDSARREAYAADITYGTNNEFGFDYLRDNMKLRLEDYVQRHEHHFAIVDEVDSILVDEARTPLIISGPSEDSLEKYQHIHRIMHGLTREIRKEEVGKLPSSEQHGFCANWQQLEENHAIVREGDFIMDEKSRSIALTDNGAQAIEKRLVKHKILKEGHLFDYGNIDLLHHVNQALKAVYLFRKDVDYVVNEGQVVIVDEFTGRLMPGRRFSDGLHQALEAKEGVRIEQESQTYASITFQNYFRLYKKLAGMTGTAKTEEEEFLKIYTMPVLEVPTNRKMVRNDLTDLIYKTRQAKLGAIVKNIANIYQKKQPVLVGTISIEASEELSRLLQGQDIPHTVLNAKNHAQEADIIASAGQQGRVTISTNMAGRGTDIKLSPGVNDLGGLFVIGTERHESRRIDNQLRGRSGRQGDPGASQFYLSLEDDLMRLFGGERIAGLMNRLNVEDEEAIHHPFITRAIANAQKRVEGHHFETRKHVLEYDDVMNRQREIIYSYRRRVLGTEAAELFLDMVDETVEDMVTRHTQSDSIANWDLEGLKTRFRSCFGIEPNMDLNMGDGSGLRTAFMEQIEGLLEEKRQQTAKVLEGMQGSKPTPEDVRRMLSDFLRYIILNVLDGFWKDHLLSMDHLREAVGFAGYAQKRPLDEYKREGFSLFEGLMLRMSAECTQIFFRSVLDTQAPAPQRVSAFGDDYQLGAQPATESKPSQAAARMPNWGKKKKTKASKRRRAG